MARNGNPRAHKTVPTVRSDLRARTAGTADDQEERRMDKWECMVCGYIYDPAVGDPDSGIEPGTPFEAIPDDWYCPDCGADKDMFDPI